MDNKNHKDPRVHLLGLLQEKHKSLCGWNPMSKANMLGVDAKEAARCEVRTWAFTLSISVMESLGDCESGVTRAMF